MQLKPITAIIVLFLVVASLLVAGCTTSTTSNTNQTPTSSTATHEAFLEKYLAAYNNTTHSDKNRKFTVWDVTWLNSTSLRIESTQRNLTTNYTWNVVDNIMLFPTTQDATNYLNAMNKTAYSLASTQYVSGAYQNVAGHAPTVYKAYEWLDGNVNNISEYKHHIIQQVDNIIFVTTEKRLS